MAPLRIAYLCPCSPWPTTFGGAMRIEALWSALQTVGEVHLAVMGERPAVEVRRRLRAAGARIHPARIETPRRRYVRLVRSLLLGRCIPAARYVSTRRVEALRRWLAALRPEVVVFGDEYLASLLPALAPAGALTIVDTLNAASRGHWRVARAGPGLVRRLEYALLATNTARVERRFFPAADQVWAVSPDDAAFYAPIVGHPVHVVPNVVDVPDAPPMEGAPRQVVLTGSYSYLPSEDSALRLIALAAPLLRTRELERLTVVGREPTARMRQRAAATPGVEVTGPVPTVEPYLRRARVFAAPLAAGSGTKLKVLEAMAQGRAVLTTPVGAEGIAIAPGVHAEVVPLHRFGETLRALVADPDRQARLGRAAHALVVERYSRQAMAVEVARRIEDGLERARAAGHVEG